MLMVTRTALLGSQGIHCCWKASDHSPQGGLLHVKGNFYCDFEQSMMVAFTAVRIRARLLVDMLGGTLTDYGDIKNGVRLSVTPAALLKTGPSGVFVGW